MIITKVLPCIFLVHIPCQNEEKNCSQSVRTTKWAWEIKICSKATMYSFLYRLRLPCSTQHTNYLIMPLFAEYFGRRASESTEEDVHTYGYLLMCKYMHDVMAIIRPLLPTGIKSHHHNHHHRQDEKMRRSWFDLNKKGAHDKRQQWSIISRSTYSRWVKEETPGIWVLTSSR